MQFLQQKNDTSFRFDIVCVDVLGLSSGHSEPAREGAQLEEQ